MWNTFLLEIICQGKYSRRYKFNNKKLSHIQGGHKAGKHGKPGKLREFEKLSKSH